MINEILSLEVLSNLSFKGASGSNLPSRNAALNQAKRDAGVPKSQQPVSVDKVKMTGPDYAGGHVVKDSNGNIVITRQYVYTDLDGTPVYIQEHTYPHTGSDGPHFNVKPEADLRNGVYPGIKEHYPC